ncbi:RhoGAP domain containing protein [Tritrichomonas foetus]|uniref:RhoGAP domain containing protein n=1 Tax=Tritrichomonas foetus TaxID=1144522 RepID=A0A1J4KYV2_9EUKA|nr:RhoGAP domain containing protein [Tritrichomonas foetus]|eukprot:OHT14876.1 RhoGAP domain containing protein [Tritrichomonas foetus]
MTGDLFQIDITRIIKQGSLDKMGGSVHSWKKRWFVLADKYLHYFKDQQMKEAPLGSIPIVDCTISLVEPNDGPGFYFLLRLPQTSNAHRNEFLIRSSSSEDRSNWILSINKANTHTIFKSPLTTSLKVNQNKPGIFIPIPYFFIKAFKYLEDNFLKFEGLYRLNGSSSRIEELVNKINQNQQIEFTDPNTTTGLIKLFMTSLPESLIPVSHINTFKNFNCNLPSEKQIQILRQVLRTLPLPNYLLIVYLFQHLRKVLSNSSDNKMDERAISVCIGPSLIFTSESSLQYEISVIQQEICKSLLINYDQIFLNGKPLMLFNSNSNMIMSYNKIITEQDSCAPFVLDVTPNSIVQTVFEDSSGWTISIDNDRWGVIHQNYLERAVSSHEVGIGLAKQTAKWSLKPEDIALMGVECPESVQLFEILMERIKGLRDRVAQKYSK